MKIKIFTLACLICSTFLFAQNNDFNNGGGDLLWSNSANWTLGVVPNTTNTGQVRLPLLVESLVDTDITIKKIQNLFGTSGNVFVSGDATLILNPDTANFAAIDNVSNNDVTLSFKGNVEINNPAGFTLIKNTNGASNNIEFADGSTLTLTTNLSTTGGSNNAGFSFNGSLAGDGNLRFGANTTSTFGSTSSNDGYLGELPFLTNSAVIVNTADNNVFYNGLKLQVNGNNASIEINGENVIACNIVVGGSNSFTFAANKNQSSMNTIAFSADGTLNLVVDASVTNLSFADNSDSEISNWNAGTLNITGYQEGVIRFGTDNSALTADQLSQIVADNDDEAVALDQDGFLVNESSLSNVNFESNMNKRMLNSTIATNQLSFITPQNSVKIIDINGRVLVNNDSNNQTVLSIESLSPGHYFAVFEGKNVERFIKK
jgi:hypothetical protein